MPKRKFTDADEWLKHFAKKWDIDVPYEVQRAFSLLGKSVHDETVRLLSGNAGQTQFWKRPAWLARFDHPFARRHGAPTAESLAVGVISGELLASIRVEVNRVPGYYSISVGSVGVAYAKFVLSEDGTLTMLPRGVKQAVSAFALKESHKYAVALGRWIRRY